jgi:lysophospholipase L1-like esterase
MSLATDIATIDADTLTLHQVIHGSAVAADVVTEGGSVPTLAKRLAQLGAGTSRGAWTTSTAYALNDVVTESSVVYRCTLAHTSGTFATDLAASKWQLNYGGINPVMSAVITAASLAAARAAMGPWGDALATPTGRSTAQALADLFADLLARSIAPTVYPNTYPDAVPSLENLSRCADLGLGNAQLHGNSDLILGAVRQLLPNTEDISSGAWAGSSITKDSATTMNFRDITLGKVTGSSFYSQIYTNIGGVGSVLTAGKYYMMSCFVKSMKQTPQWMYGKSVANTSDFAHGGILILPTVRRIRKLIYAATSSTFAEIGDPSTALASTTPTSVVSWVTFAALSGSFDIRIGGFQLEECPSTTKLGIAMIGDSTMAGASGKKDYAGTVEWSRWLEGLLCCHCYNRGVGGDTTTMMVARYAADITPLAGNSKYCIIQGGINDIIAGDALATIQSNLSSMYASAITDGMIPVVCTCTPFAAAMGDSAKETKRTDLNTWIFQTFPHVLDLASVVVDPYFPNSLRKDSAWYGDGTHFGAPGKLAIGIYAAQQSFWDFAAPSPYQKRAGTMATEPVRAGALRFSDAGLKSFDVSGTGSINLRNDVGFTGGHIRLTGTLTGARVVYVQGFMPKLWTIENLTTGAYALSIGAVASDLTTDLGTYITIASGKVALIYADGAGVKRAGPDTTP